MGGGDIASKVAELYRSAGLNSVFSCDGDFIFFYFAKNGKFDVLQSNYGGPNLYFRKYKDNYYFSTDASLFFSDYKHEDIDKRSVCDYLLYGSLIGGNTFSRKVKALVRGQELIVENGKVQINTNHIIRFDSSYNNINKALDELVETYLDAVKKRSEGRINKSTIFLSGGKDSRLLLSSFSNLYDEKINCISFGHMGSDEVQTAKEVAALKGNHHDVIVLKPADFVKNASEYIKISVGMDWFPQSYILSVFENKFRFTDIYAGSFLSDIVFHAKYSDDNMDSFKGTLSEYLNEEKNKNSARMNGFTQADLDNISIEKGFSVCNHLNEDTAKYEGRVSDIFLGYMNNTNGANQISFRTDVFPSKFMDTFDPSQDKNFVNALCHLPLQYRCSDELHVKMIEKIDSDYLIPIYSDYRIPMQSTKQEKLRAKLIESERETLIRSNMRMYNPNSSNKIYYVHDYADFEGYMTYDASWIQYMDSLLKNENAFIYNLFFDKAKVYKMLDEHRKGRRSWKKPLILLSSLEQFFQLFLS